MTPAQLDRLKDYSIAFGTDQGKRVLEDMRRSYCKRTSHVDGDPYTTAFNEGRRDVVLSIERALEVIKDPLLYEQGEQDND